MIEEDTAYGIKKIAEPIGLIAAVIPTTNPDVYCNLQNSDRAENT